MNSKRSKTKSAKIEAENLKCLLANNNQIKMFSEETLKNYNLSISRESQFKRKNIRNSFSYSKAAVTCDI